jgi:hypothetical protein
MSFDQRLSRLEQALGGPCSRCHGNYVAIAGERGYLPNFPPACPECGPPPDLVRRYVRVDAEAV